MIPFGQSYSRIHPIPGQDGQVYLTKFRIIGNKTMEENNQTFAKKITKKRFGCLQVFGLLIIGVLITASVTVLVLKTYLFPSEFKPVTLSPNEEKILTAKLEKLDSIGVGVTSPKSHSPNTASKTDRAAPDAPLEPEPYSEKGLKREIVFMEKELNALLAKNTDLAGKLAIDLSDDLVSAKLLLPLDDDFPILGGKILRVKAGVVFSYDEGKPMVILKGITIMGLPMPNAWLGGIKNIDLVEEFGDRTGFWKTFSEGVEDIKVEDGFLKLKFKE